MCVWFPFTAILLNVMFLNHNDFFKMFGITGTPRDMKNYTWVISVTGLSNMFECFVVAACTVLMGIYNNLWIEGYVSNYLATDGLLRLQANKPSAVAETKEKQHI